MFDKKRLIPLLGAVLLSVSAPAFAQAPADPAAATAAAEATAPTAEAEQPATPVTLKETMKGGKKGSGITPFTMFRDANLVVKVVMVGLILASLFSWLLLFMKIAEFMNLNRVTNNFLEAFRSAKSLTEVGKVAMSEEFEGNPMADMAAGAVQEIELSKQAGLAVTGQHRDSTLTRAEHAINAVQSQLSKRLSTGMQFLASVGSTGPFIGLFGTVYGIMNSFIGIAESNTTNLAVVAPGIAEALLATGIGLFAAIPAVVFYNYFQTRIVGYGTRTEGFVAELTNALSRQLDKGA